MSGRHGHLHADKSWRPMAKPARVWDTAMIIPSLKYSLVTPSGLQTSLSRVNDIRYQPLWSLAFS